MTQNKWEKLFDEFMDLVEFSLVKYIISDDAYWGVIDHQYANLGDIESDRFVNAADIIDRMEIYENDYIINDICECLDEKEIDYDYEEWADLLKYRDCLPENHFEFDLLDMICNHFEEIDLNNCIYKEE